MESIFLNMELPLSVLVVTIGILIVSLIVKWIWNSTLIDLMSMKKINYWQSIKILVLSMILFGGGSSIFSQTISNTTSTKGVFKTEFGENVETKTKTETITIGLP